MDNMVDFYKNNCKNKNTTKATNSWLRTYKHIGIVIVEFYIAILFKKTAEKKTAEEKKFSDLKLGMDAIFKIAKQLRKDNQYVVGDKCVKDDSGNLSFDNEAKKVAWKQHYERLLNEEFSWNPEDLTADPVVGPPIHIDVEMVVKAITKMKTGKAAGPSGRVAEMLKASGDTGARLVADRANEMVLQRSQTP